MMTDSEIMENAKAVLGDAVVEMTNPSLRRIFIKIVPNNLPAVATALKNRLGFHYLATISGLDVKDEFEIIYHFADHRVCFNVRTRIPKSAPHIASITAIIPGAILYERELQDMFGINVDQIPDPRPLVLPEDWPPATYPLRKDWKFERPEEKIPRSGEQP